MTRSVEIPEAAVEAGMQRMAAWVFADDAQADFDWSGLDEDDKADALNAMRVALEAALPYLAPAEPEDTRTEEEKGFVEEALRAADSGSAGHWPTVAGYLADEVRRLRAAPAGDGGLPAVREALEKLVEQWQYSDGKGFRGFYEDVQSVLAAHPAAETEGCASCGYPSLYQGGCTNCGASAVPAGDGGLREALEALCEYAEANTPDRRPRDKHGPIGRKPEPRLTVDEVRKLLTLHAAPAVPQPVDREALRESISVMYGHLGLKEEE